MPLFQYKTRNACLSLPHTPELGQGSGLPQCLLRETSGFSAGCEDNLCNPQVCLLPIGSQKALKAPVQAQSSPGWSTNPTVLGAQGSST